MKQDRANGHNRLLTYDSFVKTQMSHFITATPLKKIQTTMHTTFSTKNVRNLIRKFAEFIANYVLIFSCTAKIDNVQNKSECDFVLFPAGAAIQ